VTALVNFPMLGGLDEGARRRLLSAGDLRRFGCREIIFHEGDLGDSLHLIMSGRVAVRVTTPLGDTATLSLLATGDTFGELALLDPDARRTATVVALEPTRTLALRRPILLALRQQHAEIDQVLSAHLAGYVRRLSAMVLEAMYLPVEQRVARRLAHVAELYADPAGSGAEIRLTQDDVASLAGTTRATANRVLRALESRGLLVLSRGRITVPDRARLAGFA